MLPELRFGVYAQALQTGSGMLPLFFIVRGQTIGCRGNTEVFYSSYELKSKTKMYLTVKCILSTVKSFGISMI